MSSTTTSRPPTVSTTSKGDDAESGAVTAEVETRARLAPHQQAEDFICGGVASFVNVCATFPLNKVMFRQQVHGFRFFNALRQLRKEGLANLYRGLLPPLLQRTASVSLMFGTYHKYRDSMLRLSPNSPYAVVHTLAALGAGTTEAILAPLERVQVVLQVKDFHERYQNTFHAFRDIAGRGGVRELYRGTSAIVVRNGLSNVLFFGLRQPLMDALPHPSSELGKTFNAFVSGAGLGAFLSSAFFALNVVKTRMQTVVEGPHVGMLRTARTIFDERGRRWRKLYRGIHINYTRSFISWGIINAVYEFMKNNIDWS